MTQGGNIRELIENIYDAVELGQNDTVMELAV